MGSVKVSIPYGLVAFFIIFSCNFTPSFTHGYGQGYEHGHNHTIKTVQKRNVGISWRQAVGTWYGSPTGFGSDGGACGYTNTVSQHPFSSMITAISPNLYQNGKGCGVCYQVKCKNNPSCSGKPVRVVVTDLCPIGGGYHFDLSGTAFGALAKPGQENSLRNAGVLQLAFARIPCDYSRKNINFKVDAGSNPYYLAFVVEYADGDGDISKVFVRDSLSKPDDWTPMQQLWGALWKLNSPTEMHPPFSILLKSRYSGNVLIADKVIPKNWIPGNTYVSLVNFPLE